MKQVVARGGAPPDPEPNASLVLKKPGANLKEYPDTRMDRNKQNAFNALAKEGDVDGSIGDIVKNATPKERRAILNNAIIRAADGTYTFNPKDKAIQRVQVRINTQKAGTQCRGVGKQEARTRCGGAEGLAEAIRKGNVTMQVDALNRERYYIDDQVADDMAEKKNTLNVKGQASLTDQQWRRP